MTFKELGINDTFEFENKVTEMDRYTYKKISSRKYIMAPHGKLQYEVGTIKVKVILRNKADVY